MSKKKSSSKVEISLKLDQCIWPIERDILFRPGRLKYVRKLIKPKGCVFCLSAKNGLAEETLCVYQSKHSQIVINKFPYNSGHLLVLPLVHIGEIFDFGDEQFNDLHQTLRLAMRAVRDVYQPAGFNMGMNHGATAGAGIPDHLHYHIVPRWNGDLNFFPLIAETKLVVESVDQTYKKYRKYFDKVKSAKPERTRKGKL